MSLPQSFLKSLHRPLTVSSFFLLLCSHFTLGSGTIIQISDVQGLIDLAANVSRGTTYSETTVFLDSDLDFTGKDLEPIGNSSSKYFSGVFNGQGYAIRNLNMTSSSQYLGLFGYSTGLIIRNVIFDPSCSITSSISSSHAYAGGIIGYCSPTDKLCRIENNVNMGSVTFSKSIGSYSLNLGGVAGYLGSGGYDSIVKNCANYGDVTHSGTSGYSNIGGIVGYSYGSSSKRVYIYNSLNHGTITHSGTTSSSLRLGGIAGYTYYTSIENCVSGGKISSTKTSYIGSIVGYVNRDTHVIYCYYTSDLCSYNKYGYRQSPPNESNIFSYDSTTFQLNGTISVGSYIGNYLIGALNGYSGYYTLRDYSHWLLNKDKKDVSFTINNENSPFTLNSQIVLMPSLASEGNTSFDGWYTDDGLTASLTSYEVMSDTELYGIFEENTNNYTIFFDTKVEGVSIASITAPFNSVVTLPSDSIREHCNVAWWETDYGDKVGLNLTVPSRNITLYAAWKCTHIETFEDFISFSKVVNSGMIYYGTTVFLDSDIDFSGMTFEPIGTSNSEYFNGTFNGQGHVISNLVMTSSLQYVGLFGYSGGLTIKNVILDSSCSITSSYHGSNYGFIGGIIGDCCTSNGPCTIENSVNMGSVSFDGTISSSFLYLGGIAGRLYSYNYDPTMKNCGNYGDVTHAGTSKNSYIGGIVGYSYGSSSYYRVYIYNSLNHGTITHSGKTSNTLYLGGITGYTYCTTIENCVSVGQISSTKSYTIGNIIGYLGSQSFLDFCFWDKSINTYKGYGSLATGTSDYSVITSFNNNFELSETVSVGSYNGSSLINALNAAADYYAPRNYSRWVLNEDRKAVSFITNDLKTTITLKSKVILLPSLGSKESMGFDGWYTDSAYSEPFTSTEITSDTNLYGRFKENTKSYTITFNTRGGTSIDSITAQFGSVVDLPKTPTKGLCTVASWETESGDKVPWKYSVLAHNVTLYALWSCTHIKTTSDLIDLSRIVNSGLSIYKGTTVFLDSDIDFSGMTFETIGKNKAFFFCGSFYGQGHVIRNLNVTSSTQYVGLFGHSEGFTIKNVILDSSCSITSSYNSSDEAYLGGIIGYCNANYGPCTIENSVNMGSVTFRGNTSSYSLYLGGIVGYLGSSSYEIFAKNCANYGDVTHAGTNKNSHIGGIVGFSDGYSSSMRTHIYNCLNHGTIAHNGTTVYLYLGGITGYTRDLTIIENCLNSGLISSITTASNSNVIGNICGLVSGYSIIKYCFWNKTNTYDVYGSVSSSSISATTSFNDNFELSETVSVGSYKGNSLIGVLNAAADFYILRNYSHWILNNNKKAASFTINERTSPIKMDYQIILLPSLEREKATCFDGWYTDSAYSEPFTTSEITSDINLYGRTEENTKSYTITFNTRGGTTAPEPITAQFGSIVNLPKTPTKDLCTLISWETDYGDQMPWRYSVLAHNVTLYALWQCTHIKTASDFIDLSRIVNSGLSKYERTTVFLDSDIDLSGMTFEPIGTSNSGQFLGTFYGQGHMISNLTMNIYLEHVGLFGYSENIIINDLVIDSSCSFSRVYSNSDGAGTFVSSVIGV